MGKSYFFEFFNLNILNIFHQNNGKHANTKEDKHKIIQTNVITCLSNFLDINYESRLKVTKVSHITNAKNVTSIK